VLSPGPCSPAEAGVCVPAMRHSSGKLPILGVCLGHQSIGAALGGNIVRAQQQMHGKASTLTTDQQGVYLGLPRVQRDPLPLAGDRARHAARRVLVTSTSEDGEIMGVRHRDLAGTARRWRACSSTPSPSCPSMAMRC
jgi:anthranilate synthase component 2